MFFFMAYFLGACASAPLLGSKVDGAWFIFHIVASVFTYALFRTLGIIH